LDVSDNSSIQSSIVFCIFVSILAGTLNTSVTTSAAQTSGGELVLRDASLEIIVRLKVIHVHLYQWRQSM